MVLCKRAIGFRSLAEQVKGFELVDLYALSQPVHDAHHFFGTMPEVTPDVRRLVESTLGTV